jgi:hypothetical protein
MHRRIEPVGALLEAEVAQDRAEELLLGGEREVAVEKGVVCGLACLADDLDQLGPEDVEDGLHLGGRHSRLVLVQERVVRGVARLHQLRPAERDVVHALQGGQEDGEVVGLAGLEPRAVRLSGLTRPGGRKLGGHAACLLPVAPRDADEAGVIGVVVELGLERRELVEQAPDLVGDEALVCEARERRAGLGPCGRALRGHHRPLVPAEHAERAFEVVDLGEVLLQLCECRVHRGQTYP